MCKPGKSFNTGVKSYFSSHESALQEQPCRRGSAPYRRSDWNSRLWAMSKNGQFKTTCECLRSLSWTSLESLNSLELLEATLPAFATAPSNAHRSAGRSPRNQPSEEVQDRAKAVTSRSNEFNDCRAVESFTGDVTQQSFPEEARTDHVTPETKNRVNPLNSRENETKHPACFNNKKQVTN